MRIRIEPGFAFFLLLLELLAGPLAWPLLAAAALHELSHLAALYVCGMRMRALTLRFADARIETLPMGYAQEILCALAGPAANLLCCALLRTRMPDFAAVSLLLGSYNLLPVLPLDGGRILLAALSLRIQPETARRVCTVVSTGVCCMLLGLAGYTAIFCGAGVWPLAAATGLALRLHSLGNPPEKLVAFPGVGG